MRQLIISSAVFLLSASAAFAACTGSSPTWTSTADYSSVNTCVGNASTGDTINVQAGTQTWNTALEISGKALTIVGAGTGSTNITSGATTGCHSNHGCALIASTSATNFLDVSGFTFIKSANNDTGIIQIAGPSATGPYEVGFRFHNNEIQMASSGARGIRVTQAYGLIDHNTFTITAATGSIQMLTFIGSSEASDSGLTPWQQAFSPGDENAIYVEDNTFSCDSIDEDVIDTYWGARAVIRFNSFSDCHVGYHGNDSGFRGTFSWEVYDNTFANNSGTSFAQTVRGGTGFWFDNPHTGTSGWSAINLMTYRALLGSQSYPGSYCDGTNYDINMSTLTVVTADTNTRFLSTAPDTTCTSGGTCTRYFDGSGTHGYPCRDQIGRTHNQAFAPLYFWNNSGIGAGGYDAGDTPPAGNSGQPITVWMTENRDYYNTAAMFDGTEGVGSGAGGSKPGTCTTTTESGGGVGYWATDEGEWNSLHSGADGRLYRCSSANTWTLYYTPYTYPHPLQGAGGNGGGPSSGGRVMIR